MSPTRARRTQRLLSAILLALCLCAPRGASAGGYFLVSGGAKVWRFDADTGASLGAFASDPNMPSPHGIALGPDGHVYVAGNTGVFRFDEATGALIDHFVTSSNSSIPLFGPDGQLYLIEFTSINRYSASTGAYIGTFGAAPSTRYFMAMAVGPDGNLYTASASTNHVDRFDVATGAWLATVIDGAQINAPASLAFGTDGKLYVGQVNGQIRRFDASTFAPLGVFATVLPVDLSYAILFGPNGNLFAGGYNAGKLYQFDAATGSPLGAFASDPAFGPALRAVWMPEACGNGIVGQNEQCDDGAANSDSADACRTTCQLPACGDGIVDSSESCDDGAANSDTVPDACRTTCVPAVCGDSVVDSGESCDDGPANSDSAVDACRTTCALASCGDGVLDSGETCDAGAANSDTQADACRTTCVPARCGDGALDSGEQCDDLGTARFDGCDAVCAVEGGFSCSGAPSACTVVPSPQDDLQQKCLVSMNKGAAALSKAWSAESARCMKLAASGSGGATACLTSAIPPKAQAAMDKLGAQEAQKCLTAPGQLPVYAYQSSAAISAGMAGPALELLDDLFGPDLDAALVPIASDKAGAACQAALHKSASTLIATSMKRFVACKTGALSGKLRWSGAGPVQSLMELQNDVALCLADSSSSPTGVIRKAVAKLQSNVAAKCGAAAVQTLPAELAPGCGVASVGGLLDCAQRAALCRSCETENAADGLGMSCDLYDDAFANGSCP